MACGPPYGACPALQVKVLIQHIEARQLLPPAVVLQALAPNSHLQLGVVKVLLFSTTFPCFGIQRSRPHICCTVRTLVALP